MKGSPERKIDIDIKEVEVINRVLIWYFRFPREICKAASKETDIFYEVAPIGYLYKFNDKKIFTEY